MRVRLAVLVAVVVLTAGCSSFVGDDRATPTLTPADVPTEPATPDDPRNGIAPGLTAANVTHPAYLAERHTAAVAETSYVLVQRYHEDRRFGTITSELDRTQRLVVENATTYRRDVSYRIEEMVDGELRSLHGYAEYADGHHLYRSWLASNGDGRTFRRNADPSRQRADYATLTQGQIRQYLTLENATVARVDVPTSDREHFRVTGTRTSLPTIDAIENYTARAVIREDGFVRSLDVTYDARDNGRDVAARYNVTYGDVGTATVTPPAWADAARATFDEDGE